MMKTKADFIPLNIAVLTVSDTRDAESDTSGRYLAEQVKASEHRLFDRMILEDDIYKLRAQVSTWIVSLAVDIIITTGGTGFADRDQTPEALTPLFDKTIDGFGELFRQISYTEIGTSTVQSRAVAGIANKTLIFCLPGSSGACKTAWEGILVEQLDNRHRPCNFLMHTRKFEAD